MRRHHTTLSHHTRGGHGPGGHGRGGHPRQRAKRGAVRHAVLTLLDEHPMHGYELITELESRSGGRWRPSAGSIYPALNRLEEHGLISSTDVDGKRRFELTDEGREILARERTERGDDAPPPWEESGRGGRGDLRRHVAELVGQVRQIGRFGTSEQIERTVTVLEHTKRSLYEILAAGSGRPDDATADVNDPTAGTPDDVPDGRPDAG